MSNSKISVVDIINSSLEQLASFVINLIGQTSYLGITALMALESANIPIPSEVIMPFSGFLVSQGKLDLWLVSLAGAVGCTIGSAASYGLGRWSNETWVKGFVNSWGRFFITEDELAQATQWLQKYGDGVAFFSRLLPIVRTFISFPAGVARINFLRFIVYTFVGSLIWSLLLAYIGFQLGENWDAVRPIFRQFDYLIAILGIIALGWYIWHRGRKFAETKKH